MIIRANDIKKKGVSLFEKLIAPGEDIIINVRGKNKYVVLDIERYKQLRELELDTAYKKVMDDIKAGNYKKQTAREHVDDIVNELYNNNNRNIP